MVKIHGKEYTEVKDRIREFRERYPDWSIETRLLLTHPEFEWVCFKAIIKQPFTSRSAGEEKKPYRQTFTGHAFESRSADTSEVNFSSWVENCETSAIGRALANMDIGVGDTRPSNEEMQKVARVTAAASISAPKRSLRKIQYAQEGGITPQLNQIGFLCAKMKEFFGHDKYFVALLNNRKVDSADRLSSLAQQELLEAMEGFLTTAASILPDNCIEPRQIKGEEEFKKYTEKLDKLILLA